MIGYEVESGADEKSRFKQNQLYGKANVPMPVFEKVGHFTQIVILAQTSVFGS